MVGDEIARVGKSSTKSLEEFESALNAVSPGSDVKVGIFRGKTSRNIMLTLPKDLGTLPGLAAANAPVTSVQLPPIVAPQAQSAPGMIAVASFGPELTSPVAGQFDTAPYFVLIDTAQRAFRVEVNPNTGVEGYGIQLGQLMRNLGVSKVLAGSFSPSALSTMGSLGVSGYPGVTGTVQDALAAYQAGGLLAAQTVAPQALQAPGVTLQGMVVQPQAVIPSMPQTLY